MHYRSIKNVDLFEKKVVIRLDLNVPIKNVQVQDTTRIERIIPTLQAIISKKPRYIIILSHLGRPAPQPKAMWNQSDSLAPIASVLQKFLSHPVIFTSTEIGPNLYQELNTTPANSIVMAENIRFYEGEEKNSQDFSKALAQLGDIFVNDAFSCCHRAHASVVGITQYLPSYAGLSLDKELHALEQVLISPERPVIGIIAGSKVSTKIDLLMNLMEKLDYLFVGGGIANTLLFAQGYNIGTSLIEKDCLDVARLILEKFKKSNCTLVLPIDAVVAKELTSNVLPQIVDINAIENLQAIYDIGPKTLEKSRLLLNSCKTVLWNGPLGVYEVEPFGSGSTSLSEIIATQTKENKLISIIGGGDTIASASKYVNDFTYASTAGGAFLEWLEGKFLPGLKALEK